MKRSAYSIIALLRKKLKVAFAIFAVFAIIVIPESKYYALKNSKYNNLT